MFLPVLVTALSRALAPADERDTTRWRRFDDRRSVSCSALSVSNRCNTRFSAPVSFSCGRLLELRLPASSAAHGLASFGLECPYQFIEVRTHCVSALRVPLVLCRSSSGRRIEVLLRFRRNVSTLHFVPRAVSCGCAPQKEVAISCSLAGGKFQERAERKKKMPANRGRQEMIMRTD